jgi:transcriptional regulator with XRE-family HTH domain
VSQPQQSWRGGLVGAIAKEVRRHRKARGMSIQQVSDAAERLGVTIPRPVLSNLETGRRSAIDPGELLILAAVLGVPPALLMFPVGADETVEYLPDMPTDPWTAYRYFVGDLVVVSGQSGTVTTEAPERGNAIETYRRHDTALWRYLLNRGSNPAYAERGLAQLHDVRSDMREQGWKLPPLPEGLDEQMMLDALPTIDLEHLGDDGSRP